MRLSRDDRIGSTDIPQEASASSRYSTDLYTSRRRARSAGVKLTNISICTVKPNRAFNKEVRVSLLIITFSPEQVTLYRDERSFEAVVFTGEKSSHNDVGKPIFVKLYNF